MTEQEVISYAHTAMKNLSGDQNVMHSERHLAVFLASFSSQRWFSFASAWGPCSLMVISLMNP